MSPAFELMRQLADQRRLASAVDAHHQHDVGPFFADDEGLRHRLQNLQQLRGQRAPQRRGVRQFTAADALLEGGDDAVGRFHANIGQKQRGLQLFQHVRIDAALAEQQVADAGGDLAARLGHGKTEPRPARCRDLGGIAIRRAAGVFNVGARRWRVRLALPHLLAASLR